MKTTNTTTIMNTGITITDSPMPAIIEVGEADFDRMIGRVPGPWLLVFATDNCPACERLLAQLARLVSNGEMQAASVRVVLSQSPGLAAHFGVWAAPALLLIHDGSCVWRFVGEPSRRELEDVLARSWRATFPA